jgi:sulfur carrier protein
MTQSAIIAIQLNGQTMEVPRDCTISQLLQLAEMRTQLVAVEVNLNLVPRSEHSSVNLKDGDVVEAVTLVGGG